LARTLLDGTRGAKLAGAEGFAMPTTLHTPKRCNGTLRGFKIDLLSRSIDGCRHHGGR